MSKKNQQQQKNQKQSEKTFLYSNILADYVDITIRGLIAFLTIGLIVYYVFSIWLGSPIWITIPVIFILSVIASPYLSKIRVGYVVQERYEEFLQRIIDWRNKNEKKSK